MGIRSLNDPSGLDGPLVERVIGASAYDVVKAVYLQLSNIELLAPNSAQIAEIAAARADLLLLVPHLASLDVVAENVEELINGLKPASSVTYNGSNLQQVLDQLFYAPIVVSNLSVDPQVTEKGSSVQQVNVGWTLNRSGTLQTVNGQTVPVSQRAFVSQVPIGSDAIFTLHVQDGSHPPVEAQATVHFGQKRYWGVSAEQTLIDAAVLGLGHSEFADGRSKTIVFDASGGRYPYYAYPAAWGDPTLKVQGLSFSDFVVVTRSFTNASNYASQYKIVRFNGLQTGASIEVAFA